MPNSSLTWSKYQFTKKLEKYADNIVQKENPASATITVTAIEVPELTEVEESDRLHLERKVERAFFE
ncbi:hypothetical protein WKK05_04755 [Nostoc sp. UHCC 0302]|uniref:hypothetical protein n=1 Tax=Nostoc sp. UHCC 0302 TaxID=3134896 RepID=UPI00311CD0E7